MRQTIENGAPDDNYEGYTLEKSEIDHLNGKNGPRDNVEEQILDMTQFQQLQVDLLMADVDNMVMQL